MATDDPGMKWMGLAADGADAEAAYGAEPATDGADAQIGETQPKGLVTGDGGVARRP
jgi:hypothetical protein